MDDEGAVVVDWGMRFAPSLVVLLALTACGDDGSSSGIPSDAGPGGVDAAPGDIDAAPLSDAPPLAGCDHTEQNDLGNDDYAGGGTPEATGLTLATRITVCGTIASTHYDAAEILADADGYSFTIAQDRDVLITLSGAGAQAIGLFALDIYGGSGFGTYIKSADFVATHGATSVRLPAGTYELLVVALSEAALTAPVAYEIRVDADAPDTRCPALTTGGFPEASDGASSTDNDMITIALGSQTAISNVTTSTTDVAEVTNVTLGTTASERFSGSLADVTTTDSYEDRDTFAFMTGATTDQLTVRVDWPGTTADVDFYLYEAGTDAPTTVVRTVSTTPGEFRTFAVKPNQDYWLLVGAKATSTGLPVTYAATLCGAAFVP